MVHTGWRSRGYLPHCDERGLVQHIIFGLADAMPQAVPASIEEPIQRAEWADRELDANHGSRLLAKPEHAAEVQRCLLHEDAERYAVAAWCIMPTHVHVVVEQFGGHPLADIVQTWKSVTSHVINRAEARKGKLWRREYSTASCARKNNFLGPWSTSNATQLQLGSSNASKNGRSPPPAGAGNMRHQYGPPAPRRHSARSNRRWRLSVAESRAGEGAGGPYCRTLMGKKAELRFNYIQANAKFVADEIDV